MGKPRIKESHNPNLPRLPTKPRCKDGTPAMILGSGMLDVRNGGQLAISLKS